MMKSEVPCVYPTKLGKGWPYEEYYMGERDKEKRKAGDGEHHWTGAESLESYTGNFLQDTMHGFGTYRWRFKGPEGIFATYDGNFYGNTMHGYGLMSFDNGRYFTGLFHHNLRWGPGIESQACRREDVGFWAGNQLLRLTWRPATSNVALDFGASPIGKACIEPYRKMLATKYKIVREVNSAIELLKQYGSQSLPATENWTKLYPKHCNDLASPLCDVKAFEHEYYDGNIRYLEEVNSPPIPETTENIQDTESEDSNVTYYAWNNNATYIHIMKHCYKHEKQRSNYTVPLEKVLAGPRSEFKAAGKHELDCRTVLMASYLGHVTNVVQLVNEFNVNPDVTDIQGNNCIMYATCGDQTDIIHFLKEAGGNIDAFNDCCVTPLGIAIMRYLCTRWDIPACSMVQALIPPQAPPTALTEELISEWKITRDLPIETPVATTTDSKTPPKASPSKRLRAVSTVGETTRRKTIVGVKETSATKAGREELFTEETRLYNNINTEYIFRVNDLFSTPTTTSPVPYLFEVRDLIAEIEHNEGDNKKVLPDKNNKKNTSKLIKPSRSDMSQSSNDEMGSVDTLVRAKIETLSRIMSTITTLLSDGADPSLVRCPQPALLLAVMSGCSELIQLLCNYGADVNEKFPQCVGYSALDIAISQPLSNETLSLVKTLLECGAKCKHRLKGDPNKGRYSPAKGVADTSTPGPTLLHAVLAKSCDNEAEDEIRLELLDLLLRYNCDPILRYKGRSAIDMAINKNIDLLETFVKCPRTDLNAVINDANETVLLKMFIVPFCNTIPSAKRLMIITNLLLYGADPFLECTIGEEIFKNLFVYTKKILSDLGDSMKPTSPVTNVKNTKVRVFGMEVAGVTHRLFIPMLAVAPDFVRVTSLYWSQRDVIQRDFEDLDTFFAGGLDVKGKKSEMKSKKDLSGSKRKMSLAMGKMGADVVGDYSQALDLVVECARILLVRWLQARLYVELLEIVKRYKHRNWHMILPEHKNKKTCGLWLSSLRCIEIWDIMKTNNKKGKTTVDDRRVLRHMLCIVQLYCERLNEYLNRRVTTEEKELVDSQVKYIMYEHKIAEALTDEEVPLSRQYVMPELTLDCGEKYNVCFDCLLPLGDTKILCCSCKLVSFCGFDCMKENIERAGCHPCSEYLRLKYFPSPDSSSYSDPNI